MINSTQESIDIVIKNIESSIDYYINQHKADTNGAARIRADANIVRGLIEYRDALKNLHTEFPQQKKRGNPNFGKNNPYLKKEGDNE